MAVLTAGSVDLAAGALLVPVPKHSEVVVGFELVLVALRRVAQSTARLNEHAAVAARFIRLLQL